MIQRVNWHGTADERLALLHALAANCECRIEAGRTVVPCAAHLMLAHDQRAIDGLLFGRNLAGRLVAEEFEMQHGVANLTSRER